MTDEYILKVVPQYLTQQSDSLLVVLYILFPLWYNQLQKIRQDIPLKSLFT